MSESHEPRRAKPVNYDELFPGRFLKAGLFLGKTPTFTISDYDTENLPQDDGRDRVRGIISFREEKMQWALNSTNGQCLKAMFGTVLRDWVGKRVTLCTEKDRDPGGKGMVDAIRVLGSPDIDRDITIDIALPRRKPKQRTLRATGAKRQPAQQPQPSTETKPRGDIEDMESRLQIAPEDERVILFAECKDFTWTPEERKRLAVFLPKKSATPNPENDGRD